MARITQEPKVLKGLLFIEPKPMEPFQAPNTIFDTATAIGFLREYGFGEGFK